MSDTYQAVYDAVRSRLSNGDIGAAVGEALRIEAAGLSHAIESARMEYVYAASAQQRPCVLFHPSISIDGDKWCALYGENLQDGVAGFGDSPALAMAAFDAEWTKDITK
jgi:hypothetical protein